MKQINLYKSLDIQTFSISAKENTNIDLLQNYLKHKCALFVGNSGAGKSTLIRCVNRLVEPTSGSATLNDINLTKLSSRALRKSRRKMGMIFQEYALVERLTVMENVLSGRLGYVGFWRSYLRKFPQTDVKEAFRLLEKVGLEKMFNKRADELANLALDK